MHGAILAVHIGMGTLGLLSGVATLVFRKGAAAHRVAGTIFVLAMLLMAASASILGVIVSQPANVVGGLMTIYFIATAWMAGHRRDGETGAFEIGALVGAIVLAFAIFRSAVLIASGVITAENPYVLFAQYTFSGIIALAAVGDLSVTLRRGIAGAQRIARHLWRMCIGLIIAVGSFAAQGAKILPPGMGLRLLSASMMLVLVVMLYWLARVLLTNWYKPSSTTSA